MTLYHASPAHLCDAPSRWFPEDGRGQAEEYAERAARTFAVVYSVFRVEAGKPKLIQRYDHNKERS